MNYFFIEVGVAPVVLLVAIVMLELPHLFQDQHQVVVSSLNLISDHIIRPVHIVVV